MAGSGRLAAGLAVGTTMLLGAAPASHAAALCPISYGLHDAAKPNKLYLYYPASSDATFPEFGDGPGSATSPADPWDTSLLTSYTGTAADLQAATSDVVIDDYCEFNVQVLSTTSAPPATFARRSVVAIGTDDNTDGLYGKADGVDAGDGDPIDDARVWAGRFQGFSGGAGGALNGANSTLQRWANSIGGTAAHEAGHNYGLTHTEGALVGTGEDAFTRHIMPAGPTVTAEHRAAYRRHFNDANFATLAGNVGLSIQTMHNWDLENPNAEAGHQFRLTFLSPQDAPIMSWAYTGPRSPWTTPTLSGPLGTQTFKGTTYNRFQLTWSTGQSWLGPTPGQVPGGGEFHVGATFSGVDFDQPDPIIITRSELLDANGTPLALQPRLPAYDAGDTDAADGSFDIDFSNLSSQTFELRNVRVLQLPRVLSIDAMVRGGRIFDVFGDPFDPYKAGRRTVARRARVRAKRGTVSIGVARLGQRRHILDRIDKDDCEVGDRYTPGPDVARCKTGYNVSLFPATTLYVRADVVQPRVRHFDRKRRRYVVGPVTSRVFYQVAGFHPDLNRNRVDDALDIATKQSADRNRDGVPDEVQRRRRRGR
ncbi:MAG: hypothetical protein M3389_11245, partial [Actinomycetota bacterium]|nr:hypothetical protein [Actinomycetota bacterium]